MFADRMEAGRLLGEQLQSLEQSACVGAETVVLALPRGGVPVGYEVAKALGAPLDVFVVRKLGLPGHDELAMGALASGGVRVLDENLVRAARVSDDDIQRVTAAEQAELERREA